MHWCAFSPVGTQRAFPNCPEPEKMEIKSKRQLQLIKLSRQLEIGWNPVGFLRPPSGISGAVWAGRFLVSVAGDVSVVTVTSGFWGVHGTDVTTKTQVLSHARFFIEILSFNLKKNKKHFVHDWTLLFFSTYMLSLFFPSSPKPGLNIVFWVMGKSHVPRNLGYLFGL